MMAECQVHPLSDTVVANGQESPHENKDACQTPAGVLCNLHVFCTPCNPNPLNVTQSRVMSCSCAPGPVVHNPQAMRLHPRHRLPHNRAVPPGSPQPRAHVCLQELQKRPRTSLAIQKTAVVRNRLGVLRVAPQDFAQHGNLLAAISAQPTPSAFPNQVAVMQHVCKIAS